MHYFCLCEFKVLVMNKFIRSSKSVINILACVMLLMACQKDIEIAEVARYSLFISATDGGTVSTEGGLFEEGTLIKIEAIPDRGYKFSGWDGIENLEPTVELVVRGSLTIKANFELNVEEFSSNVPYIVQDLVDTSGYILAIENGKQTCYLIDHTGQKLRTWNFDLPLGQDIELAHDGSLYGLFQVPDPNEDITFGGKSGLVRKIDKMNNVVWEFRISSQDEITHHDLELMPNGNVLVLVWQRKKKEDLADLGYITDRDIFMEKIVEINPESNQIVWKWESWDHIIQDRNPAHPTYGDPKTSRNKIDLFYNYQSDYHRFISIGDIMHANGIAYSEEHDVIAISVNFYNEVWFIDHSTSTHEAKLSEGGNFNLGGDLLYRFGNPGTYSDPTPKIFDFNHHPSFVRSSNEYHLLIFNNNAGAKRSKVMEFELPVFSNTLLNESPNPRKVFEYSNDELYFDIIGGAVRLPNGNTLICEGDYGFWEVNDQGQLLWKYNGNGATFWRGLFYSKQSDAIKSLGL